MRISLAWLNEIRTSSWEQVRHLLADDLERLQASANTWSDTAHHVDGSQIAESRGQTLGELRGTLAEQPTNLTAGDDGLIYFVTDYNHIVRWDGSSSTWKFMDEGAGFFAHFAITPAADGWALCDGSTVSYLVVGAATLTTASIALPDLVSNPSYLKSGAAYTGSTVAAIAPGASTATDGSGTSGAGGDHSHGGLTGNSDGGVGGITVDSGATLAVEDYAHKHTLSASGTHTHSTPNHSHAVTVDATGQPRHLVTKVYFRK